MRGHTSYLRLAVLIGLLGPCISLHPSLSSAQTPSIVLVQDLQGHYVYINTNTINSSLSGSPSRAISPGAGQAVLAISSAPTATPVRGAATGAPAKTGTAASAPPVIQNLVQKTAGRFQVDPKLVDAIIRVESAYNPRAVSSKGAMGLMQLIPATAQRFGVKNPFDPRQNIRGGVTFLRYLLDRFNGNVPLSLAAYNAGEHRVGRDGGIPAIPETVTYVRKVTSLYRAPRAPRATLSAPAASPAAAPLYRYVDGYGVVHFSND